eukprot:g17320.t1
MLRSPCRQSVEKRTFRESVFTSYVPAYFLGRVCPASARQSCMDLVMISTFLPIDSFALITDQFPPIWCKAVGFIATFVSIFSSFAFMQVACLFDKCVCMDKRFSRFELWDLAKYGSQMAMVALAYSLVPLLRDNL